MLLEPLLPLHASEHACMLSCSVVSDSATPWTVARQVPLSMGFCRQKYWGRLPFPPPGDLPDLCLLQVSGVADGFFTAEPPRKLSLTILQSYLCEERVVRYTINSLDSRTVNFDSYTKFLFFHDCFH